MLASMPRSSNAVWRAVLCDLCQSPCDGAAHVLAERISRAGCRSLLLLRDYEGDVEDLALTFTLSDAAFGTNREVCMLRLPCMHAACSC